MEEQRLRAADDFATIRSRLEELRRERERADERHVARRRSGPTSDVGRSRSSGRGVFPSFSWLF